MQYDKKETRVIRDFQRARDFKRKWVEEAREDFEYALGHQWKDSDKETLRSVGVAALTINKIQPLIFMISGIQRQNRADYRAFPEGEEDSLPAEIATVLLKNVMKTTQGDYKVSEQFEDGIIGGEGWIEPYIDYTYDLVNGELKLKKVSPFQVFPDPDSTEYDLSDAEYVIKFTPKLTENQIVKLYPDKESKIKNLATTTFQIEGEEVDTDEWGMHIQTKDYDKYGTTNTIDEPTEKTYDLTEYYYKKYVVKHLIADKNQGRIIEAESKEKALEYVEKVNFEAGEEVAVHITRSMPEIWVCAMVGTQVIDEYICPFYPQWQSFPLIPFFAHRITTPISEKHLMTQGIVRSLKDPQRELNKRRTQELRHINSTANSGWLTEKGSFANKAQVQKFGSSPGVILEYKQGSQIPQRISPVPLSQGHAQLAEENKQDMRDISGINTELLAMNDKNQSGRAIYLRQQQGVVMIQRILDNFSRTKKLLGRFILSQLGEVFDVDSAGKVLGRAFIEENFQRPIHEIAQATLQKKQQAQAQGVEWTPTEEQIRAVEIYQQNLEQTGREIVMDGDEVATMVDQDAVGMTLNMVLTDRNLPKYDIAVGEGANSETIKYANYLLLMDLAQKNVPIPPEVLIEESLLSSASKEKIKQSVQDAQRAAAAAQQQPQR